MQPRTIIKMIVTVICLFTSKQIIAQNAFPQKPDTVSSLANVKNRFSVLKVRPGLHYRMQKVKRQQVFYGEGADIQPAIAPPPIDTVGVRMNIKATAKTAPANYYPTSVDCGGQIFAGKDRAVVKTHTVTGNAVTYPTIDAFFASATLVPDATMRSPETGIVKDPEGPRVTEEKKNITIKQAYIYGIYRESDNDFHMIIGNGLPGAKRKLFNVEISGLPGTGSTTQLSKPRNKIIGRFGNISCSDGAFKPIDKLIPIKISGSLFYDIDHAAGIVGFGNYKPKTAWELHPVTDIIFLDE